MGRHKRQYYYGGFPVGATWEGRDEAGNTGRITLVQKTWDREMWKFEWNVEGKTSYDWARSYPVARKHIAERFGGKVRVSRLPLLITTFASAGLLVRVKVSGNSFSEDSIPSYCEYGVFIFGASSWFTSPF